MHCWVKRILLSSENPSSPGAILHLYLSLCVVPVISKTSSALYSKLDSFSVLVSWIKKQWKNFVCNFMRCFLFITFICNLEFSVPTFRNDQNEAAIKELAVPIEHGKINGKKTGVRTGDRQVEVGVAVDDIDLIPWLRWFFLIQMWNYFTGELFDQLTHLAFVQQ